MTYPISPDEVAEAKCTAIPSYVFEAVNDVLARKYTCGSCTFTQNEIMDEILPRSALTRNEIFDLAYLNFEEAYRDVGWEVVYDKPGYNEAYDAYFKFSKARK